MWLAVEWVGLIVKWVEFDGAGSYPSVSSPEVKGCLQVYFPTFALCL